MRRKIVDWLFNISSSDFAPSVYRAGIRPITIIAIIAVIVVSVYGGYRLGYARGDNLTRVVDKYQSYLMQKVDDDPVVDISTHLARLAAYENTHGQSELYNEIITFNKQLADKLQANGENVGQ